jgi:hypothetical protein
MKTTPTMKKTIITFFIALAYLAVPACCKSNPTGFWCKAETAAISCTKAEGSQVMKDAMTEIEAAIATISGDPVALLEQVEAKFGDIFGCAWAKVEAAPGSIDGGVAIAPAIHAVIVKAYSRLRKVKAQAKAQAKGGK